MIVLKISDCSLLGSALVQAGKFAFFDFLPASTLLMSVAADGNIRRWSFPALAVTHTINDALLPPTIIIIASNPLVHFFAVGYQSGKTRVYEYDTHNLVKELAVCIAVAPVSGIAVDLLPLFIGVAPFSGGLCMYQISDGAKIKESQGK